MKDEKVSWMHLQSQINPHFLYNTLESITWMVEAQRNKEAVCDDLRACKASSCKFIQGKDDYTLLETNCSTAEVI